MLQKISFFVGILIILFSMFLMLTLGISINNSLGFGAGAILVFLGRFYNRFPRWFKIFVKISVVSAILLSGILLGLMYRDGSKDTVKFDEEVALVLGCGIKGEKPAPMLRYRLDRALEYLQKNPNATVIVSGGQGYGETITEAAAMKRYLVDKGVGSERIVEESESRNTYENVVNTKELLAGRKCKIALITTDFHMFRALKIAKMQGLEVESCNASLSWYLRLGSLLREIISILKFFYLSL